MRRQYLGFYILICIGFCNLFIFVSSDTESGNSSISSDEIVIEYYPFYVFFPVKLQHGKWLNCGGSIINPQWVMTVRHCIMNQVKMKLFAGQSHFESHKTFVKGREVQFAVSHPKYDLALLKLKQPLEFNEKVQNISLPRAGEDEKYETAEAISLGQTETKPFKTFLEVSKLEMDTPNCIINYVKWWQQVHNETMKPEMVSHLRQTRWCAQIKKDQGLCPGSSGGPLVAKRTAGSPVLIGSAEKVIDETLCSQAENSFSLFVRVSVLLEWINRLTQRKCSGTE